VTIGPSSSFAIQAGGEIIPNPYVQATWDPNDNVLSFDAGLQGSTETMQIFDTSAGTTEGSPPWVIATAIPEPRAGTLALIGGLLVIPFVRRRRKAG
jgi:hypothetical protein